MLVSHEKEADTDNDRRTKEGLGEMPGFLELCPTLGG